MCHLHPRQAEQLSAGQWWSGPRYGFWITFHFHQGKGLDTCYSAAYMSQTRDQQRFTISEVAADWQERAY